MRLPSLPGPSDVLSVVAGVRDGLAEALALVPRVGSAVGRMEDLLDRVSALLARVEGLVDRTEGTLRAADGAIEAVGRTQAKADEAITAVATTQLAADEAITAVARTQAAADEAIVAVGRTTSRADDLLGRVAPLLDGYTQPLTDLAPSVRRLAETLEPHEVEALVTLIDRLPRLVNHLDEDILPVLESLGNVGPDLHNLLDTVEDLRQVVKGFPGSRLFRRRGAQEIAEEEAAETASS